MIDSFEIFVSNERKYTPTVLFKRANLTSLRERRGGTEVKIPLFWIFFSFAVIFYTPVSDICLSSNIFIPASCGLLLSPNLIVQALH